MNESLSGAFHFAVSTRPRDGEQAVVAPYHFQSSFAIEPEKLVCGFGRCFRNFFQRNMPSCCDCFSYDASVRGLAAFSAEGNRRQIWAIGFDHEFPKRDFSRDISHGCAVFESDNSGERNEVVEIENLIRLIERTAEAMKNAAQLAGVWLHDFQCVFPGIPLMNDDVKFQLYCEVELLLK
jgi:hypothetical protein